jgi:hippurate hydrolase
MEPAVVTVGEFHAGTKSNVIPGEAHLAINIRSYDDRIQHQLVEAIERIVRAEADAGRCPQPPDITRTYGGPVTDNDAGVVERVASAHRAWFGSGNVIDLPKPVMGSEDFGLFGRPDGDPDAASTIPTGFWFWGGAGPDQLAAAPGDTVAEKVANLPSNHHPAFRVDPEPTIRTGTEALAVAALAYLAR